MNYPQDSTRLVHRADDAMAKLARAEADGRAGEIADARRDVRNTHDEIAATVREGALANVFKAATSAPKDFFTGEHLAAGNYSETDRRAMASTGEATRDGSYPIKHRGDIENAVENWKRAGRPLDGRKHITRRATELGCLDCVPDDWRGDTQASAKSDHGALRKRAYTPEELLQLSARGVATRGGEYVVLDRDDLKDAIARWRRAGQPNDVRAFLMTRAAVLNARDLTPDDWNMKPYARKPNG